MRTLRNTPGPPIERWPPRACKDLDTEVFFPEKHGLAMTKAERYAKRICWGCRARPQCAEYAIPITTLDGIWGAMTARERDKARTERGM